MATETRPEKAADAARRPLRFTAAQFWRLIEAGVVPDGVDVELVRGRIYRMTKHEPHNFAVGLLAEHLRNLAPPGFAVREEKSMRHDRASVLEPDVAIVRGDPRTFRPRPPATSEALLIVEVCASTRTADYRDKYRLYAAAGVPAYWVLDVEGRKLDAFAGPAGAGRDAAYSRHQSFAEGEPAPVVLDGREVGRIAAKDLLPPIDETENPRSPTA